MSLIDDDALGEADVGELRRGDEVADRPHAVARRVRQRSSTSTKPRSSTSTPVPSSPRSSRQRAAADRHDDRVDVDRLRPRRTAPWCRRRRGLVAVDLDAGADVDAPLLERAHDDVGDVVVAAGQDLGQRLEDRDLGAEVGHDRGELAADGAAADDDRATTAAVEHQHLVGGHDEAAVDLEAGDRAGHRARREDHVGRL